MRAASGRRIDSETYRSHCAHVGNAARQPHGGRCDAESAVCGNPRNRRVGKRPTRSVWRA
ncbi:MAG: hypothetical protein D6725_08545 [Planctomycetota bacterium]|nr:MAG: hypothetical protein D6725_08545 [Planctomycetota bacterium]